MAAKTVYLDVTHVLKAGPQISAGIPRVELGFVSHAIADAAVVPMRFSRTSKTFVALDEIETAYLGYISRCHQLRASPGLLEDLRAFPLTRIRLSTRAFRRRVVSHVGRVSRNRFVIAAATGLIDSAFFLTKHVANMASSVFRGRRASRISPRATDTAWFCEESAHLVATLNCSRARLVHDLIPIDYPEYLSHPDRKSAKFSRDLRLAAGACSSLIAVSHASSARLRHWLETAPDLERKPAVDTVQLPSFLTEGEATETGRSSMIDVAGPFILYCSTIDRRKNHILLIEAQRALVAEWKNGGREPPTLVFVGRMGTGVEPVRHGIEDPALRGKIIWSPRVSDAELFGLYRRASFTVFPSFAEGWGLGASESLDFGTPALVSTDPAVVEATQNLMPAIDPNNLQGWTDAIRDLSSNPSKLDALRTVIRENYKPKSPARFAEEILEILKRV